MQQTAATNQTPMTSFFRQHCRLTTELFADLTEDFPHTLTHRPLQHFVAVFGDPDEMITVMK